MSEHIHKSHNVSKLMYHFVLPAKYRRVVIDEKIDKDTTALVDGSYNYSDQEPLIVTVTYK